MFTCILLDCKCLIWLHVLHACTAQCIMDYQSHTTLLVYLTMYNSLYVEQCIAHVYSTTCMWHNNLSERELSWFVLHVFYICIYFLWYFLFYTCIWRYCELLWYSKCMNWWAKKKIQLGGRGFFFFFDLKTRQSPGTQELILPKKASLRSVGGKKR